MLPSQPMIDVELLRHDFRESVESPAALPTRIEGKARSREPSQIAGAGFEPATSGL
jgi:hypothetical protein